MKNKELIEGCARVKGKCRECPAEIKVACHNWPLCKLILPWELKEPLDIGSLNDEWLNSEVTK